MRHTYSQRVKIVSLLVYNRIVLWLNGIFGLPIGYNGKFYIRKKMTRFEKKKKKKSATEI